jgi:hypothetical protein
MTEGRCDERLKDRVEESTCLTYTGLYDKTNYKYLGIKMRCVVKHSVVLVLVVTEQETVDLTRLSRNQST